MSRRWRSAGVAASLAVLAGVLTSCVFAGAGHVPPQILELEHERGFDPHASEVCAESLPASPTLLASEDSTAGEVREMYEQHNVYYPSGVDSLPSADDTYAAICVFDASELEDSSADRMAYWVSSDSVVGGIILIALWDQRAT